MTAVKPLKVSWRAQRWDEKKSQFVDIRIREGGRKLRIGSVYWNKSAGVFVRPWHAAAYRFEGPQRLVVHTYEPIQRTLCVDVLYPERKWGLRKVRNRTTRAELMLLGL